jgi:hypothetical protein
MTKIGEIKETEIEGKNFSIQRKGTSISLELQGLMMSMLKKAKISKEEELEDEYTMMSIQSGFNSENISAMKKLIIACVNAPQLNSDRFEELGVKTVMSLFFEIYYFHYDDELEKKKKLSKELKK